jgi:multicomponent Na+:H+ antiporter subunit G
MAAAIDLSSWALLLAGSLFVMTGGVGILRLPDFYTRLHAAGITDTAGAGLIMLGLMLQAGFTLVLVKLALVLAFLFFTGPTSAHALARAAMSGGVRPWPQDAQEDEPSKA